MYCSRCGVESADETNFCPSCGLDLAATTPIAAIRDREGSDKPEEADKPEKTELDVVREALKDDYEIDGELGRGGMAIVYRARERSLDREVALKVLPFSLSHDKQFEERFQREARTAAKLEHPNIIPIYRVGKAGGVIYFAMKLLKGKSLAAELSERGSLQPEEIREILRQCAGALGYASHHGIVHRDIKPDNIMYSERGVVVLTDFGIAKAATGTRLTGTGMAIGTPYYMSPEQARAQKVDGRSDLYSLGVVGYQCLAGSVPFDGEDSFSIGYKHIMEEVSEPKMETEEQRELFPVIQRLMAKDPTERYQSAEELVAALEGRELVTATAAAPSVTEAATVVAPASSQAMAPSVSGPAAPSTPTTPMPQSSVQVTDEKPKKRSAVLVGALTLLIVGGIGGGGYLYTAVLGNRLPLIGNPFVPSGGEMAGTETQPVAVGIVDTLGAETADTSQTPADSTGEQLAADPEVGGEQAEAGGGDEGQPQDTTAQAEEPEPVPPPPPPPEPGRLVLAGLPEGARVLVGGQVRQGTNILLDAGTYRMVVRADGYEDYAQSVQITAGQRRSVAVEMVLISQCETLGPSYNADGSCFDRQPGPKVAPFVPLTADVTGTPSQAIIGIKV
ncbi:MAG: protein kinase [Acidimicrobiia bacterium]